GPGEIIDLLDGVLAAPARSEAVTGALEPRLPLRLKRLLGHGLEAAVGDGRDPEGPLLAVALGDVHAPDGSGAPGLRGGQLLHQFTPRGWRLDQEFVHARRVLARVDLRDPPDGHEDVGVAAQHELLERADLA